MKMVMNIRNKEIINARGFACAIESMIENFAGSDGFFKFLIFDDYLIVEVTDKTPNDEEV